MATLSNNNKGISLIVLIITILVMIILTGTVTVVAVNQINDSRKVSFAQELLQIENAVDEYYFANDSTFPAYKDIGGTVVEYKLDNTMPTGTTQNAKNQITALEKTYGVTDEQTDDIIFNRVDLSMIDVKQANRGIEKEGNLDIYIVSNTTRKVYYLKGLSVGDTTYYCLNESLSKTTGIKKEVTTENTLTPTVSETLRLTKDKNTWSNNIKIDFNSIAVATVEKFQVSNDNTTWTDVSNNYYIVNSSATVKPILDVTTNLYKSIYVRKLKIADSSVLASGSIVLDNLDLDVPTLTTTQTNYTDFYVITLTTFDKINNVDNTTGSGVNIIKHEKMPLINMSTGVNINTFGAAQDGYNYFSLLGAKVEDNSIKIPNTTTNVYIYIKDNAGNENLYLYTKT